MHKLNASPVVGSGFIQRIDTGPVVVPLTTMSFAIGINQCGGWSGGLTRQLPAAKRVLQSLGERESDVFPPWPRRNLDADR
jgi:hypothetical protein